MTAVLKYNLRNIPSEVHVVAVGNKYNRWEVVSYSHKTGPHHYWVCRCQCGKTKTVQQGSVVSGRSSSCGCLRAEVVAELHRKHGSTKHPAYQSWLAMRRRCADPAFSGFAGYGARGIAVCADWQEFEHFWRDMGATWAPGLSIDRIDVNGPYEKGNCRWATDVQQANNKRNNAMVETPWGRLTKAEAARRAGISYTALKHRISRGWPADRIFSEPVRAA